jgi:hypothetical protein
LIELHGLTETHYISAYGEAPELNGIDQKSSGLKFDRVATASQRLHVMGQGFAQ